MSESIKIELQNPDGSSTSIHQFGKVDSATSVLIIWPAMGVKASYYELLAETLASNGFLAITADLRGNGFSSIRPSRKVNFSYKDQLEQEYLSVTEYVKKTFPSKKLYLFGHSLGGQLSCLFASKQPAKVDGLILSATCSVYHKGWKGMGAYRILLATQFTNIVAKIMGYFPGKKLGFGGTEARGLISDWSQQARTGNYILEEDKFDYESGLQKLEIPVLAISYEGDTFAPTGAVEHLLNKLSSSKRVHIHVKRDDPRNESFTHFSWAKKPTNIVALVKEWILNSELQ